MLVCLCTSQLETRKAKGLFGLVLALVLYVPAAKDVSGPQ